LVFLTIGKNPLLSKCLITSCFIICLLVIAMRVFHPCFEDCEQSCLNRKIKQSVL
jgi:hypothetical protein